MFLLYCCFFGLVNAKTLFLANVINTGKGIELRADNNLISLPIKNYYTFKNNGEMEIFDHEKSKIFIIKEKFQYLRCFPSMCKFCNRKGNRFLTKPIIKSYELTQIPRANTILRLKRQSLLEKSPVDILLFYKRKIYGRILQSFTSLFYSSRNILKENSITKALIVRCRYCYVISDKENDLLKSIDTGNLVNCTNYLLGGLEKFCQKNTLGKK